MHCGDENENLFSQEISEPEDKHSFWPLDIEAVIEFAICDFHSYKLIPIHIHVESSDNREEDEKRTYYDGKHGICECPGILTREIKIQGIDEAADQANNITIDDGT